LISFQVFGPIRHALGEAAIGANDLAVYHPPSEPAKNDTTLAMSWVGRAAPEEESF